MHTTRLLIADDYVPGREGLAALLRQEGYDVSTMDCTNLQTDRFHSFNPDLCLLALGRADRSAFKMLETVRVLSSDCLVIALASSTEESMTRAALSAGASAYMPKPFQFSQLLDTLRLCGHHFSAPSSPTSLRSHA